MLPGDQAKISFIFVRQKNANPIILNIRHNFFNQLKEMRKISRDPINSGGGGGGKNN